MASCLEQLVGLLYWAMLAASTVGPGTIIVMAKAGSDHELQLLWCVIIASFVAYIQQEAAARLFIISGLDLGSALRFHFNRRGKTPQVSRMLAVLLLVGNVALECAQFVGLLASAEVVYKPDGHGAHIGYAIGVSAAGGAAVTMILLCANVDLICQGLGVVVLLMVVVFAIATQYSPITGGQFFKGLFVPTIPVGAADIALSMIATTAIPMNVFLASSLAAGFTIREMRVGIGFACAVAGILSILIVIVGSGIDLKDGEHFEVSHLAHHLHHSMGNSGKVLFVFGLFAASFSSAITIALGTAVSVQALLSVQASFGGTGKDVDGDENSDGDGADAGVFPEDDKEADALFQRLSLRHSTVQKLEHIKTLWHENGARFRAVLLVTVWAAAAVAASQAPTVQVVMVSQIIGGVLLPCVTICLLLVSCNLRFTRIRPMTTCEFAALVGTCAMTVFLAAFVLLPKFGVKSKLLVYLCSGIFMVVVMMPVTIIARRTMRGDFARSTVSIKKTPTAPTAENSDDSSKTAQI